MAVGCASSNGRARRITRGNRPIIGMDDLPLLTLRGHWMGGRYDQS